MNETTATPLSAELHSMQDTNHHIWVDGSSIGNPGPAAWAVLIDGHIYSGYAGIRTNNEAEIIAVYEGILRLTPGDKATIHTDSNLVIGWFCRGWRLNNPNIKAVKETIDRITYNGELQVSFRHTKGHADDANNNRVDSAARHAAKSQRGLLYRTYPGSDVTQSDSVREEEPTSP